MNYLNEKFFEYYTVNEMIGKGRFSLVKLAICNTSQRRFAAKFLTRHPLRGVDLDEEYIEREIRTLYSLRHSNIVSLRAAAKTTHDFIIVMKWLCIFFLFDLFYHFFDSPKPISFHNSTHPFGY